MKYYIVFKHTIEEKYKAEVEADSEKEAKEIFEESPFDYVVGDIVDSEGLDYHIDSISKADEDE